tara:strand:+ start:16842 stop:16997 length:156 start_codon:yes stop_codon:yes gene_type:complete
VAGGAATGATTFGDYFINAVVHSRLHYDGSDGGMNLARGTASWFVLMIGRI